MPGRWQLLTPPRPDRNPGMVSLAGEPFGPDTQLTQLSGGQSRALMISDTALLSWSPVLLIDEIENARVDKRRALELLLSTEKIVVMATHDPVLALAAGRRLVFGNGAVAAILPRSPGEAPWLERLEAMEREWSQVRAALRRGDPLQPLPPSGRGCASGLPGKG